MAFDLATARVDFPILEEKIHGKRLVYLDSGASAQKPVQVLDRMDHAYRHEYANVHRGLHTLANRATEAFEGAREKVRAFLNAERVEEIVFTRSTTEAINLVASSFAGPRIGEGDEIVISIAEHHSNIVPWHFHRERKGAVIKWVDVADDGSFDLDAFAAALTDRTRMVAITHMSNVLGTINPAKQIVEIAHARGIPVLIDGSQAAVHSKVDVRDIGADFYVFTGHKLYGPTGVGVLYGKYDLLAEMQPFLGGGEMIEEVSVDAVTYNAPPHRFEAGTPPIVQAIGLGAAIDYVEAFGRDVIAAHEHEVAVYAGERLSRINSLRMIGTAPGKGGIFAFMLENAHAHDVSTILDRYGVAVRAGTHCAMPLLQRFGVTSTCRASFALYNGKDDVDALVEAVEKAQSFF
ncbi:cysteine desulfurase [Pelagibacterium halotolerans]|uniref:Cysteine desulfurase n=1 Tax=Pelagibacterium halotolerans (strain DSM 22347 / JCM 15775 / CGMCC 1.7692 / B2) TaxID=1082931 RepID=G4RAJ8_PELHB|nr:cysteine desulfurase [Pelagibacterium halotolerans]AEQ51548.1 cysteine desulfurase, SufS subfamily [Pelagibacterium halotolerans B2]QJR18618.1 cysteine desulfurase [Pelagibacterium halotolerans]SEA16586.1 cysteine desulfurase [Pelagibacterium halotolerans]